MFNFFYENLRQIIQKHIDILVTLTLCFRSQ